MKTAKEREEAFRRDLAELLAMHNALLCASIDAFDSPFIEVAMHCEFDENDNQTAEFVYFIL